MRRSRIWICCSASAIRNRDGAAATRLSDARCLVVGPQGIGQLDRQALAGTIADGVALIAYKVSEELLIDGKLKKLEAFDSSAPGNKKGAEAPFQ